MSDTERLYQEILDLINEMLPDMLEANRITLAQMITGVLQSKQVQFRQVAQKVKYQFKKPSLEDKFRRFVRNKNINVDIEYLPFSDKINVDIPKGVLGKLCVKCQGISFRKHTLIHQSC